MSEQNYHEDTVMHHEISESTEAWERLVKGKHDHMKIWNYLSVTDPARTKSFKRKGGFSGTDIDPTYREQLMTEVFGMKGLGWGTAVRREWSERDCAFVKIDVWVRHPDTGMLCWLGEQIGGTEFGRSPDEAYKMSVTDAFGKCVASLGLAADIYSGKFGDSKYQREASEVHQMREAERWSLRLDKVAEMLKTCTENYSHGGIESVRREVQLSRPPKKFHPQLAEMFKDAAKKLSESAGDNSGRKGKDE